jgi:hypothetical protein
VLCGPECRIDDAEKVPDGTVVDDALKIGLGCASYKYLYCFDV